MHRFAVFRISLLRVLTRWIDLSSLAIGLLILSGYKINFSSLGNNGLFGLALCISAIVLLTPYNRMKKGSKRRVYLIALMIIAILGILAGASTQSATIGWFLFIEVVVIFANMFLYRRQYRRLLRNK